MPSRPITRRTFLGQASCAAVGSLGFLSTLLNLRMANSAMAQGLPPGEDYRALVCLFFAGGMDSYNLLVPYDSAQHAIYATTRGGIYDATTNSDGLAISRESLLPLAAAVSDPFAMAMHPRGSDFNGQPGMQSLYGAGKLAYVSNVGTLVERVTKTGYNSSTAKLPRSLYSHSDQVQQWHTSVATQERRLGWAGLAADLLHAGNTSTNVSMNISLGGQNLWQMGNRVFGYTIGTTGSTLPSDFNSPYATPVVGNNSRGAIRTAAFESLMQQQHQHLLDSTLSTNLRDSVEASAAFKDAFDTSLLTTLFPGDNGYVPPAPYTAPTANSQGNDPARTLGQQLKAVVRTIKARQELGMRRQTFFVNYGGWDHHDEVINTMDTMVGAVNRCLACYWAALGEIGLQNNVTLYSASDFARTLTSNGAGSDHAWGGNSFVLGGAVTGGRIYGAYPNLALTGPSVVTNRGVTLPAVSVEEYFAELALWLGVQPHQLADVLPRIGAFYTPGGAAPVGFMQA
ncbi:DUF1501 domain-containing protein [Oleiharenicola lentus]|uniref:DUF1501 domain-containing protein n=1 Tax=Oleiharenicola lentus TaxID=2508720 RepID=UPI003F68208A